MAETPTAMDVIRQAKASLDMKDAQEKKYRRLIEIVSFFDNQTDQLLKEAIRKINEDGTTALRAAYADDPQKAAAFEVVLQVIEAMRTLVTQLSGVEMPAISDEPVVSEPEPEEPA